MDFTLTCCKILPIMSFSVAPCNCTGSRTSSSQISNPPGWHRVGKGGIPVFRMKRRLKVHPLTPAIKQCLITVYLQLSEQIMGPSASERLSFVLVQRQSKGKQEASAFTRWQELPNWTPPLRSLLSSKSHNFGCLPNRKLQSLQFPLIQHARGRHCSLR